MTDNKKSKLSEETFKSFCSKSTESKKIESIEEFQDWKEDFLQTFSEYLDPTGTAIAREADEDLYEQLQELSKACQTTDQLVQEGKITPDYSSVSGQRTLNELISLIKSCETSIEAYVPKTKSQEKKCGYTKFELAAILVRDGFSVYGLMVVTRDTLAALVTEGGGLSEVLQPNQLTIVMYYLLVLEAFQEFLSDLGMYKVMEEVQEVYKIRPRNKNKKKFNRNGKKGALEDTTDEEGESRSKTKKKAAKKKKAPKPPPPKPPPPPPVEEEDFDEEPGPMFQNKHKDNENKNKKVRAIIDNGWSNGFMPGQEIKDPNAKKPNKKKNKGSGKSNNKLSSKGKNGDPNAASNDDENGGKNKKNKNNSKGLDGDSQDPSKSEDNKYNTDTTDDDDDEDEGSSSSEEQEDDDDDDDEYIYYFDPSQGVVGKISRSACLQEKLIVSVDRKTRTEKFDGLVDHWDSKQEQDGTTTPGKTELIFTLKETLRGKARDKVGGLAAE